MARHGVATVTVTRTPSVDRRQVTFKEDNGRQDTLPSTGTPLGPAPAPPPRKHPPKLPPPPRLSRSSNAGPVEPAPSVTRSTGLKPTTTDDPNLAAFRAKVAAKKLQAAFRKHGPKNLAIGAAFRKEATKKDRMEDVFKALKSSITTGRARNRESWAEAQARSEMVAQLGSQAVTLGIAAVPGSPHAAQKAGRLVTRKLFSAFATPTFKTQPQQRLESVLKLLYYGLGLKDVFQDERQGAQLTDYMHAALQPSHDAGGNFDANQRLAIFFEKLKNMLDLYDSEDDPVLDRFFATPPGEDRHGRQ